VVDKEFNHEPDTNEEGDEAEYGDEANRADTEGCDAVPSEGEHFF